MAVPVTVIALQHAVQLASEDVLDDAVFTAPGVVPGLVSLLSDATCALQLLVGRLLLHSVQLLLHDSWDRLISWLITSILFLYCLVMSIRVHYFLCGLTS